MRVPLHLSDRVLWALVLVPLLAACGGGGGGDDEEDAGGVLTLAIESTAALDGGITFNGNASVNFGSSASTPLVGDGAFQAGGGTLIYNGLWSFDLSGLPAGALVQSATLQLYQASSSGDPIDAFALARLDHVNFGGVFPTTNSVNALTLDFAQIADLNTNGAKQVDATTEVAADLLAGRTRSQFRMRMAIQTDNDGQSDWCVMMDQETPADPALRPQLIIEYTTP